MRHTLNVKKEKWEKAARAIMGIHGLLPLLKSTMVPIHIKDLKGRCVAVDTYSWLHKGALSCSTQLCKGLPTSRHIEYCMHRVNLLRHYGVTPILVFDGGLLPMKIEQENKRARIRKENLARAVEHESNGNSAAAYECYQKAVDISPSIAHKLIQVLKQENVSYIVAPYEADAQMTFLAVNKQVDAVISEDSDLIPFGCSRIIFKMDKYGQGVEFHHSRLQRNKEISFAGFTNKMLLEMCILSGCDYLQSLPGMGLKRAHALITKFKSYDKVIKHLRYSTVSVPSLYEESFQKAMLTFQHQRVYDPISEDIVHLSDISDGLGSDFDFLGPLIPKHVAEGIAKGDLDPFTQMPFTEGNISSGLVLNTNSEFKKYKPESGKRKLDLPVQKNLLTKYFCFASLEAKRNFRAPRKSPTNSISLDTEAVIPKEDCSVEAASFDMNSSASPFESENLGNSLPNTIVENGFTTHILEFSEFQSPVTEDRLDYKCSPEGTLHQQFEVPVDKPGQALLKECEGKIRKNKMATARSPCSQHNTVNKSDQDNKLEQFFVKDDVASDMCRYDTDESIRKTGKANKKVIVRSHYFRHKSVKNDVEENEQESVLVKDDTVNDINEGFMLDSSASKATYRSGISSKRKSSPDDILDQENLGPKHMRTNASNLEENPMDAKTEDGKFGCNISHLSQYSDIAEKSLERFVSVISSFRFSSGSRASGLRAPLRDVRNSSPMRSSVGADFSQFAYVPKSQKTAVVRRRS